LLVEFPGWISAVVPSRAYTTDRIQDRPYRTKVAIFPPRDDRLSIETLVRWLCLLLNETRQISKLRIPSFLLRRRMRSSFSAWVGWESCVMVNTLVMVWDVLQTVTCFDGRFFRCWMSSPSADTLYDGSLLWRELSITLKMSHIMFFFVLWYDVQTYKKWYQWW
jgi:hypothetical protein